VVIETLSTSRLKMNDKLHELLADHAANFPGGTPATTVAAHLISKYFDDNPARLNELIDELVELTKRKHLQKGRIR
jgi:hypothetical protein